MVAEETVWPAQGKVRCLVLFFPNLPLSFTACFKPSATQKGVCGASEPLPLVTHTREWRQRTSAVRGERGTACFFFLLFFDFRSRKYSKCLNEFILPFIGKCFQNGNARTHGNNVHAWPCLSTIVSLINWCFQCWFQSVYHSFFAHYPNGAAVRQVAHYGQSVVDSKYLSRTLKIEPTLH